MTYRRDGRETITVDGEQHETVRVHRQRTGSSRTTVSWFAKLGKNDNPVYLPVRIYQYKKGKLNTKLDLISYQVLE